ncbi:hypothetical protein Aduo_018136 [Ancylostoma duodenale]
MFRFVVLASVAYFAYAQYGAPQHYEPAPVQYGAAPPPPPPPPPRPVPVIITPIRLPELEASHEFLYPRPRHSSSHSHSRERRCKCEKLKYSCRNADEYCYKPEVEYDSNRGCERAIVTCEGRQDVALTTPQNELLSFGIGIDNVLKCNRRGKWTTEDVNGNRVEVRALRCIVPGPYQPMPINN